MMIRMTMLALIVAFMMGCEKEGPAEQAGEKIDQAVEDAKESVSDAADKVGDEVEEACEKAKEGMGSEDTDC